MPTILRSYRLDDRIALCQTIDAVCAEGMMATQHFEPTPVWLHALAEPDCTCHLLLLVEDGEEVVGWCRVFPDQPAESGEVALGLLDTYRFQDWGSRLLEWAFVWAAAQGWGQVWLSTWPDNLPAAALFRRFGFQPTGVWRGREQVLILSL